MARVGTGELHAWFWWKRPEKMRPLGKPRCRWEDNIKINLEEVGRKSMDWIDLARIGTGGRCWQMPY